MKYLPSFSPRVYRYLNNLGAAMGITIASSFILGTVGYCMFHYKQYTMVKGIDNVLKTGTIPKQLASARYVVDRKDVVSSISNEFIRRKELTKFGVILGAVGTGKTYATIEACRTKPTSGVLYTEIGNPNCLPEIIACAIGMRIRADYFDLLFDKFIESKKSTYYHLPNDLSDGIEFVLDTLAERAEKFQKKPGGYVPVLFIDGVDMLAKWHKHAFIQLVDAAKRLANSGKLRIVLVSSEGNVMPPMNKTLSINRASGQVLEVQDLDDKVALKYLVDRGMSESLSKRVVEHIGGRFVYLDTAIIINERFQKINPKITEDQMCDKIVEELIAFVVSPGMRRLHPVAYDMLKHLRDRGCAFDEREMESKKNITLDEINLAVHQLVTRNLLRYDARGCLTWQNRLVEKHLSKTLDTK